ncbi:hypothetical protein MBOVa_1040 [Mycoplasmopsis bovis 8790]|nr:hypothetical protein MBOVa_1040 [Mycoplasmopsis bovis 8790]
MKKKFLLSSGILALASPFISATCAANVKSENKNPEKPATSNPITPRSDQPINTPVNKPADNASVEPAETQPSNEATNPAANNSNSNTNNTVVKKDIMADWNNIFRNSITGADINKLFDEDTIKEWNRQKAEKERGTKHNNASAELTFRLFDDTYKNEIKKAWEKAFDLSDDYTNISKRDDYTKEYKTHLSKLKQTLESINEKNWKQVDKTIENNDKYLSLLRDDLNTYKTDLERQKAENDKNLEEVIKQIEESKIKGELAQAKEAVAELKELIEVAREELLIYTDKIQYLDLEIQAGTKVRSEQESLSEEEKKINASTENLRKEIKSTEENYENTVAEINKMILDAKGEISKSDKAIKLSNEELTNLDKSTTGLMYYVADIIINKLDESIEENEDAKALIEELARIRIEERATKNNLISKIKTTISENTKKISTNKDILSKLKVEESRIDKFIRDEHTNKSKYEEFVKLYKDNLALLESLLWEVTAKENQLATENDKLDKKLEELAQKDKEIKDKLTKVEEKTQLIDELEIHYDEDQEFLEREVYEKELDIDSKIKNLETEISKYAK